MSKLREADDNLQSNNLTMDNVKKARGNIAEGIELLNERQKLSKISDSSPLGWKVVAEYESNPIADDSEDEKKIMKAQSRAERKAKDSRKLRGRGRPHPYGRADPSPSPRAAEGGPNLRRPGKCFDCGAEGHWARECRRKDIENKIISHFTTICHEISDTNRISGMKNDKRQSEIFDSNTHMILITSRISHHQVCKCHLSVD